MPGLMQFESGSAKRGRQRLLCAVTAVLLCLASAAQAADIAVTGGWNTTVDAANLQSGAGSDLTPTMTSASGQLSIDVQNTNGASWVVTIEVSTVNWPSGMAVSARRTSDGLGLGSISGGTTFVTAEQTAKTFFSGQGDRTSINVQLQMDGLSLQQLPGNYSINLIHRVQ